LLRQVFNIQKFLSTFIRIHHILHSFIQPLNLKNYLLSYTTVRAKAQDIIIFQIHKLIYSNFPEKGIVTLWALISTMSKVMYKIMNKRLIWYLDSTNRISKHRIGFRRNHSTIDNLSTPPTDFSTADMVWKDKLLSILTNIIIRISTNINNNNTRILTATW